MGPPRHRLLSFATSTLFMVCFNAVATPRRQQAMKQRLRCGGGHSGCFLPCVTATLEGRPETPGSETATPVREASNEVPGVAVAARRTSERLCLDPLSGKQ